MKRRITIIAALVLLLVASVGCGTLFRVDNSDKQRLRTLPTHTPTPKPTKIPTPEPTPEIGSRKSPHSMGEMVVITSTEKSRAKTVFHLTLSNPIRGKEALKLAQEWNFLNSPKEGEYLIIDVDFELVTHEHPEDKQFRLTDYDFDYYTNDFNKCNIFSAIVVQGEFRVEAYEGAKVKGKLAFEIPIDDVGYITLYDGVCWWKLPE